MTLEVDVLVVGGGPAGSVTSALLARRGLRVAMIDRATFPRHKPCGDYLNPGCDAVFERLGLREVVAAIATPMRGMRLVTDDGGEVALPFPRRTGWSLQRARLDHVLLQHAAQTGAAVRDGCRFTALERESRMLCVAVEHGAHTERYRARLVIGADGLRSAVARAAGIDSAVRRGRYTVGAYLEGLADRADAGATGAEHSSTAGGSCPPRGLAGDRRWGEIHLRRQGYCGVAHFAGGLANVTLAVPRPVVRGWRGNIDGGYWAWLRECPGLRDRLARARRVGPLTVVGPLGFHRRPVGLDRVMLVGDGVAHADPMTGQGVYLALRGAELCAAAAATALEGTGRPCLRSYAYARWREFGPVFAASRLMQSLAFRRPVVRRAAEQLARHPDLGALLIGMIGNTHRPGAVLNPVVLPRLLGWA